MLEWKSTLWLLLVCVQVTMCTPERMIASPADGAAEKIEYRMSQLYPTELPGASALVIVDRQPVYFGASGLANVEQGIPLAREDRFAVGSVTKPFAAMAVLMLAEDGKLRLNDRIGEYLDNSPSHWKRINVYQLLTHTSGIPNYQGLKVWQENQRNSVTPEELVSMFRDEPLDFKPGEKVKYSNSGYVLLGLIIEKASGLPFQQFLQERIFAPAGMKNTTFASDEQVIPDMVSGYRVEDGVVKLPEMLSKTHLYAAGSMVTTVADLARWNIALQQSKLLPEEMLELYQAPVELNKGQDNDHAICGWRTTLFGQPAFYHGGGIYGFVAHMIWVPDRNAFVAVLSNKIDRHTKHPTPDVATELLGIAMGKVEVVTTDSSADIDLDKLTKLTGVYSFSGKVTRKITLVDKTLFYERQDREGGEWERTELFPKSDTVFVIPEHNLVLEFILESDRPVGFIYKDPTGRSIKWDRISDLE